MSIPSVKTIESAFKKWLQPGDAQKIRKLIEGAGSNRSAEEALEAINKIIGASGVETVRGGDNHGGFWQDAVLAYVNMGDPYVATVWYEPRYGMSGRWGVGGYGDWVEYWEREHGQLEGLSGKRGSYMRVPGKPGRGLGHFTPGDYYVYMEPAKLVTTRSTQADGIAEAKRQRQLWVEAGAPRTPHYFVSYNPNGKRVWSSKEDPGLSGVRTMNDSEREQWVQDDEGLYTWWKQSRQPIRTFVRENRDELTKLITAVLDKPPRQKSWRDY